MSSRDEPPPYTPPPDTEERLMILKALLRGKPVERSLDLDRIARKTERFRVEDLRRLVLRAEEGAMKRRSWWAKSTRLGGKDFDASLPHVRPSFTLRMKDEYERWKRRQEFKEVLGERGTDAGPATNLLERKVLFDITLVGVPLSGFVDTRLLAHVADGAGEKAIEEIVDESKLIAVRRMVEVEKEAAGKLARTSEAEELRLFLAGARPFVGRGVTEQDILDAIKRWASGRAEPGPSKI